MGKQDISNRTLAALLVVAIVISLGGTYLVMQNAPGITGLGTYNNTTRGTFNWANQGFLAIYLMDRTTDFGNISHTGSGLCRISTASGSGSTCTTDKTGDAIGQSMVLNNSGNVDANVTINLTTYLSLGTSGNLSFKASDQGGAACFDATGASSSTTSQWTELTVDTVSGKTYGKAPVTLCENLTYGPAGDAVEIDFELYIGEDAPVTFGNAENREIRFDAIQR